MKKDLESYINNGAMDWQPIFDARWAEARRSLEMEFANRQGTDPAALAEGYRSIENAKMEVSKYLNEIQQAAAQARMESERQADGMRRAAAEAQEAARQQMSASAQVQHALQNQQVNAEQVRFEAERSRQMLSEEAAKALGQIQAAKRVFQSEGGPMPPPPMLQSDWPKLGTLSVEQALTFLQEYDELCGRTTHGNIDPQALVSPHILHALKCCGWSSENEDIITHLRRKYKAKKMSEEKLEAISWHHSDRTPKDQMASLVASIVEHAGMNPSSEILIKKLPPHVASHLESERCFQPELGQLNFHQLVELLHTDEYVEIWEKGSFQTNKNHIFSPRASS